MQKLIGLMLANPLSYIDWRHSCDFCYFEPRGLFKNFSFNGNFFFNFSINLGPTYLKNQRKEKN